MKSFKQLVESMSENTFWKKAEKIDKQIQKALAKEIKALIRGKNPQYQSFDDIAYFAMENAMPGTNTFTDEVLGYYANGLESIITES